MKINPRIYDYAVEENKLESQELGEHNLEMYKLNDYPDLLEEFTNKGKFAVWSSVDGKNYRLFIEEGYLEKLKPLYSKKINGIWLDFWDKCEKIGNKFRIIVLPITLVIIVGIFLISMLVPSKMVSTILIISISALFLIGLLIFRKISNNKFAEANKESVDLIKQYLGAKKFESLLEAQRSYLDEYFGYNDEEQTEEDNSLNTQDEALSEELPLENEKEPVEENNESEDEKTFKE